MFVKTGDGKIISVIETDELTEEQKKTAKILSDKNVKKSDTSESKDESGR